MSTWLKKYIAEVYAPNAGDEQNFFDKHEIEVLDHPVALDSQFSGAVDQAPKRLADYDNGEDEDVYESVKALKDRLSKALSEHARRAEIVQRIEASAINEAVSAGPMKLKDGSSVTVSAADAKVLNTMLEQLNPQNRARMESLMSKDKTEFTEILSFAKAAS